MRQCLNLEDKEPRVAFLDTPSRDSAMEQLATSCRDARSYPQNLIRPNTYEYNLTAYYQRLNEREDSLFQNDAEAALDLWELDAQATAFWPSRIGYVDELRKHLRVGCPPEREDPRCRFVFVHAPHSRASLKVTRDMLTLVFTYHQVLPQFLDFLFPFGNQQYAQGFHFSGFKYENRFSDVDSGLKIPDLGWSGRNFQFCYNLKSIERSRGQPEWPWSIRQSALYHSFDVENGRTNWIVIKGDQLLKKRIKLATGSRGLPETSCFDTVDRAFASSLAVHIIMCEWSGENWRWFINFLEEALQTTTRPTLSAMVDPFPSSMANEEPLGHSMLAQCAKSCTDITLADPVLRGPPAQAYHLKGRSTSNCKTMSDIDLASQELDTLQPQVTTSHPDFSFSDLQRIQFIQEKVNETLLVLKVNVDVLTELRQYYHSICESDGWPRELIVKCKGDIFRFETRVVAVEKDLRMQQSRTETLLRLLADRKSLLYGILEYRNMEASKTLARKANQNMEASKILAGKAHESTRNMEVITREMHVIAQKTKQETVSMRIITLVTLFFLPGTYISTLMSTDIFKATNTGQFDNTVQLGALRLYIAISLPLVVVTMLAWYGVYWWETRKEKLRMQRTALKSHV